MKSISLFSLYAALCVVPASAGVAAPVSPGPLPSHADVPYVASTVPNVWVRHMPSAAPPMVPGPAQVIVLPGGAPPQLPAPAATEALPERYHRSYGLPNGGQMAFVPPQYYPYFVATLGADGRVTVECREPSVPAAAQKTAVPEAAKQTAR